MPWKCLEPISQLLRKLTPSSTKKACVTTSAKAVACGAQSYFVAKTCLTELTPTLPSTTSALAYSSMFSSIMITGLASHRRVKKAYEQREKIQTDHHYPITATLLKLCLYCDYILVSYISWFSIADLYHGILFTILGIVASLLLLNFAIYRKHQRVIANFNVFIDLMMQREKIDGRALSLTLLTSLIGTLAQSCFKFFTLYHATIFLYQGLSINPDNNLAKRIALTISGTGFVIQGVITFFAYSGDVYQFWQKNSWQNFSASTNEKLKQLIVLPFSSYETLSTLGGFTGSILLTAKHLGVIEEASTPSICLAALSAGSATFNHVIFTVVLAHEEVLTSPHHCLSAPSPVPAHPLLHDALLPTQPMTANGESSRQEINNSYP